MSLGTKRTGRCLKIKVKKLTQIVKLDSFGSGESGKETLGDRVEIGCQFAVVC